MGTKVDHCVPRRARQAVLAAGSLLHDEQHVIDHIFPLQSSCRCRSVVDVETKSFKTFEKPEETQDED